MDTIILLEDTVEAHLANRARAPLESHERVQDCLANQARAHLASLERARLVTDMAMAKTTAMVPLHCPLLTTQL